MSSDRTTDDRGAFRLFGLAPGEYRVCATPRSMVVNNAQERPIRTCYPSATTVTSFNFPRGWNLKAVRYRGNDITDVPTEFKTGEGLEIVLSTRAAELSGWILDESGNPLTECQCQVFIFSTDPRRWKRALSTTGIGTMAKDGAFKLTGRRKGEYFVAAVPYDYPLFDLDDAQFAALAKVAERVTLLENDRKSIDLHIVKVPDR
jgi:hypothetical protein